MKSRLAFTCILFVALAPFAWHAAGTVLSSTAQVQASGGAHVMLTHHHLSAAPRSAAQPGGPVRPYGTVAARILAIADNGCRFMTTTSPVDMNMIVRNDPRLQPCTPTANNFDVQWSSPPTEAQNLALIRVLGTLAINQPNIALSAADPIIRAAVDAAQ